MSIDIQFNIDQALAKVGELVAKHGPQAVDVAAQVVRVKAAGDLIDAVAILIVAASAIFVGLKILLPKAARMGVAYREWRRDMSGDAPYPGDADSWRAAAIGISVVGGTIGFVALRCVFDVWIWVALFDPKLALAHDVLAKFAGL